MWTISFWEAQQNTILFLALQSHVCMFVCWHICKYYITHVWHVWCVYIVLHVWIYVYTHTAFLHTILEKELWTNPYLDMSTILRFEWSTTRTILVRKKWAPLGNFPQEHFLCKRSFPYVHSCSVIHLNFRMIMNVLSTMYFPVRTNRFCCLRVK